MLLSTLSPANVHVKLMLKDCKVRRGIALLEPACVVLKAHLSEDQEAHQPGNFQRSLHLRLGCVNSPSMSSLSKRYLLGYLPRK